MKRTILLFLAGIFLLGPVFGSQVPLPVADSDVMFVVNEPQDLALVDVDTLFSETRRNLMKEGTLQERDVANFWAALRNHGAPNAGQAGTTRVGLVVPRVVGATSGVLVIQGNFDKDKVLDIIARRYGEHINEHLTAAQQDQYNLGRPPGKIQGFPQHSYLLPVRDRELRIVDLGRTILISSQRRGDLALLNDTIDVLTGKLQLRRPVNRSGKVTITFVPTPDERIRLLQQIDEAYARYRDGRLNHRRGVKRFSESIRQIVAKNKVGTMKSYLEELQKATLTVDRQFTRTVNAKFITFTLEFAGAGTAAKVKAALVKHLVKEIKAPENQIMRLALQNPRIVANGKNVIVQVPLETQEDQKHAFRVMATFVARRILETRGTPVVRRLKTAADHLAWQGRKLQVEVAGEMARTSFFSIGRKLSLMFTKMKVNTDIRRCEDAYVELEAKPDSLADNTYKLAHAASRNLDTVQKLLDYRSKSLKGNAPVSSLEIRAISRLRLLQQAMIVGARTVLMTARSAAFRQAVGTKETKVWKELAALSQKIGSRVPLPLVGQETAQPLFREEGSGSGAQSTQKAFAPGSVDIPDGLTLEQAQADYQAALEKYTTAINSNDERQVREAHDLYTAKYQIYQAMLDSLEKDNK